jgi:uncharacterized membrane protein YphA (DoxX/SURF4 family)
LIYQVDYILAVFLAGLIIGALMSRPTSRIEPSQLARRYFVVFAVVIALRVLLFVGLVLKPSSSPLNMVFAGTGDATNFLFGVIFGVAMLRRDRRALLCDPAIFSVLCLSAGIGFVMNGYLSASIGSRGMSQFFIQSGYSAHFQMFIATAEVLGGVGLLIPWTALPAIAGLSIDMFGAIYTHVHNGDPLNDSTGAIAALIRFAAIVAVWAWSRTQSDARTTYRRLAGAAIVAVLCACAAVAGGTFVRRAQRHAAARQANTQIVVTRSV